VAVIFAVVKVASAPAELTPVFPFPVMGTPTVGTVPSSVLPAKNETVPVGALPKLAVLTVATNVKFVLVVTLEGNVVIADTVGACVTVNGTLAEVLAL
jgi:hypothetical protein